MGKEAEEGWAGGDGKLPGRRDGGHRVARAALQDVIEVLQDVWVREEYGF